MSEDTEYNGPRTQEEWNRWAKAHDRPIPNWPDVWTEDDEWPSAGYAPRAACTSTPTA
jgi:hypothetical protein